MPPKLASRPIGVDSHQAPDDDALQPDPEESGGKGSWIIEDIFEHFREDRPAANIASRDTTNVARTPGT